jgi:hypothetical protein
VSLEMKKKYINHASFIFGNISDPFQHAGALPSKVQGNWGSVIYNNANGFYASYDGALAAWAILSA